MHTTQPDCFKSTKRLKFSHDLDCAEWPIVESARLNLVPLARALELALSPALG